MTITRSSLRARCLDPRTDIVSFLLPDDEVLATAEPHLGTYTIRGYQGSELGKVTGPLREVQNWILDYYGVR